MAFSTEKSRQLYERTLGVLIEASSSSSRGPANFGKYPIFMERGRGSRIYDVDGNEYIDWMMAFGALPLGHAHPEIVEAITEAAATGAHFATATPVELEVAEMLQAMVPNAERVRFANTGTEAMMAAIRLARGVTGRPKILKFEGHYHGWHDDLLVSSNVMPPSALGLRSDPVKIPDSSGLNRSALDDTIVVPWNDLQALQRAVENHPGQIAAIISEGIMANMGVIPPAKGYLQGLQELAQANGILFILDETVTGFRIAPGGCQEYYKLSPDLVTFGKALGCGLPVAALCGRAEVMDALQWGGVLHYGTHNGSRIGMYAARANLRVLTRDNNASFRHTWRIAERLCAGLQRVVPEERPCGRRAECRPDVSVDVHRSASDPRLPRVLPVRGPRRVPEVCAVAVSVRGVRVAVGGAAFDCDAGPHGRGRGSHAGGGGEGAGKMRRPLSQQT